MVSVVRPIRYLDVLTAPNAESLLAEYSAECSIPQIGTPRPQLEMYSALERSGMMQVFGSFVGDRLVGFASVLTSILPHYSQKVATVESLFVEGERRDTGLGLALLATAERHAKESGCAAILYSAPADSQLERLLSLLKPYVHTNTVFCRRLA